MRGRVEDVRRHIQARFNLGDQLDIRTKRVQTNNVFEVVLLEHILYILRRLWNSRQVLVCGQLVHSRKRGDGLVDNAGKISAILRSVESMISNDTWEFLPSKNSMMSCPINLSWTILMMYLEGNKDRGDARRVIHVDTNKYLYVIQNVSVSFI